MPLASASSKRFTSGLSRSITPISFVPLMSGTTSSEREATSQGTYTIGTKVLHPTFGAGVIVNKEGNEDNLKVDIFFKGGPGKKKVAVNHVNLIVL